MQNFLKETEFLDYSSSEIQNYISEFRGLTSKKEMAIALYYKVRDGFLYDPYHLNLTKNALKSSYLLTKTRAWCVEKSIIMASCARALGIPTKLGYAIVKNHIGVEKLASYLRKPEIVFHGYLELHINDQWVKCTPTFDQRVCRISKVTPLDWNAQEDSMLQEFEKDKRFMEYTHFYGTFEDVPLQLMNDEMKLHYPHLFEEVFNSKSFSFFHL
ncbi:MAG: transglutaminase-like domain-containing protein [Lishizhenia sp.]